MKKKIYVSQTISTPLKIFQCPLRNLNPLFILRYEARSPATVRVSQLQRERYESAVEGFTTGDETENDEVIYLLDTVH